MTAAGAAPMLSARSWGREAVLSSVGGRKVAGTVLHVPATPAAQPASARLAGPMGGPDVSLAALRYEPFTIDTGALSCCAQC